MTTLTDTTTTKILPLLLKAIDLGAPFEVVRDRGSVKVFDLGFADYVEIDDTPSSKIYALVQWAVQQAISDRGWHWTLKDSGVVYLTNRFNKDIAYTSGVNPAIALLTAYLQALKAARATA